LSLTFVLSFHVKKKDKRSIAIRISCILTRYYGKRREGFKRRGGVKGREMKRE
jgi:hypothetical protein